MKGSIGDYTKFIVICKAANDGINEAKGHYLRASPCNFQNCQEPQMILQGFPFNHGMILY
ncbi:MAG: hypothetical protein IPH74_05565 [Bacteroidetes bacterium]|nr:hypothetical protein [Bacteroidota bacterium]